MQSTLLCRLGSHRIPAFGFVLSSLLFSITAVCQVLPSRCDSVPNSAAACTFLTSTITNGTGQNWASLNAGSGHNAMFRDSGNAAGISDKSDVGFVSVPSSGAGQGGVHWGRALLESFELLSVEQASYVPFPLRWDTSQASDREVVHNMRLYRILCICGFRARLNPDCNAPRRRAQWSC